jgi:8-oxo-dGTP pyrophosphatase MutT (NUDIX family)/mannose-6-phosphate isomerase-like protein (cupin superfamily)
MESVAGGIVVGRDGKIVLASQFGTSWSVPKGHVEPGEDFEAAARREILEEAGITDLTCLGSLTRYGRSTITPEGAVDDSRPKQIELFLFSTAESALAPRDPCNPDARWVSLSEAVELLSHPADVATLRRLIPRIEMMLAGICPEARAGLEQVVREALPECPSEVLGRLAGHLSDPFEYTAGRAEISFDKPYGENHVLEASGEYGLSLARLEPGASSSLHFHVQRRELFFVRVGTLTLTRGSRTIELGVGEYGFSIPGELHAIANRHEGELQIVEIFSPALLDDKVRVSDAYGRRLGAVTRHD